MKNPIQMSNVQIVNWLKKTKKSVNTFMYHNGSLNSDRGYDLADRYEELMDEAKERDIWEGYCDELAFSYEHDQYDMFA